MAATYDLGCALYFAVPTAPPWWAAEQGYIEPAVERVPPRSPPRPRRRCGGSWSTSARRSGGRAWEPLYDALRRQPVGGDAVASLRHLADGGDPPRRGRAGCPGALGWALRRRRSASRSSTSASTTSPTCSPGPRWSRSSAAASRSPSRSSRRSTACCSGSSGSPRRAEPAPTGRRACEDQAPDGSLIRRDRAGRRGDELDRRRRARPGRRGRRGRRRGAVVLRGPEAARADGRCSSSLLVVGDLLPAAEDRRDRGRDREARRGRTAVWIVVAFALRGRDVRLLRRALPRRRRRARSS